MHTNKQHLENVPHHYWFTIYINMYKSKGKGKIKSRPKDLQRDAQRSQI